MDEANQWISTYLYLYARANEYGAAASAKLFGVEILNEGFGTSIDDTVIEQQATFIAQTIAPLQACGTAQLIAGS